MPEKTKNENLQLPSRQNLPISALYAEFAQRRVPEELRMELQLADGATYGDALAKVMFDAAIKGRSVPAAHEIRESVEGKANQRRTAVAEQKFEVIVSYEPETPLRKMLPKGGPDTPHEEKS